MRAFPAAVRRARFRRQRRDPPGRLRSRPRRVLHLQIAREGLGHQKTQNGGPSVPRPGQAASAYHRYGSSPPRTTREATFFDGIDVSLMGIASLAAGGDTGFLRAGLAEINSAVEEAMARFSAPQPERTAPALAAGLKATLRLIEAVDRAGLDSGR